MLESLGWREPFAGAFAARGDPDTVPARVTAEHRGQLRLATAGGERTGVPSGALRRAGVHPCVGDWVVARATADGLMPVDALLPRTSAFVRRAAGEAHVEQVLAANVDTVLLVMGLDGDYNPRRLERYLVLAWSSGATPVVLLTKVDACTDLAQRLREVEACAPGVPVVALSPLYDDVAAKLAAFLEPRRTLCLLGSSGAGKSTLLNRLLGDWCETRSRRPAADARRQAALPTSRDTASVPGPSAPCLTPASTAGLGPEFHTSLLRAKAQRTGAVREGDDRGRHTTTHRELFALPSGALVIDTPGLRELQLWDPDVGTAFSDVDALAEGCRYRDCRHDREPGCAVVAAVAGGTLDPERLASFHKLLREAAWQERREDPLANKQQMQAIKASTKAYERDFKKR